MDREAAIEAVSNALADLQAAYDDRDRALAEYLGVGRTDLRCLDLIMRGGPQTASALGAQLHLTRGSMTTLIDRLERAGYAKRHDDPEHGKRKLVAPTPRLADVVAPVVSARRIKGERDLGIHTDDELRIVLTFLQATTAGQSAVRDACIGQAKS